MSLPRPARRIGWALGCGLLTLATALGPAMTPARAAPTRATSPILTIWPNGWTSLLTRNFNPCSNGSANTANWENTVVYEPLYVVDQAQFKEYPWLATAYTWSKDLSTLTFTIRHGVRWSDGAPFSAKDVYYTLVTLPSNKRAGTCYNGGHINIAGVTITRVTMPAPDQVALHFQNKDATVFFQLMTNLFILPEHIYGKIKDVGAWVNPNPVGTGPYTQVQRFTPQGFDLGKNPYYWQRGKPAVNTIRIAIFTSADAGNLALESGQVDWGGSLIPRADRLYDARNPNYHHFFGAGFSVDTLFLNLTKYPYNLVAFRKALSMAMNRQAYNINGRYGYGPASDAQAVSDITGKTGPWSNWVDHGIPQTLAQYNPAAAKATLKAAGFMLRNGKLIDPKGHPVTMELLPTFSLAETQIMQRNFQDLGIDVTLRQLQYAGFFDKMQKGQFDAVDGWNNGGPSPYYYYYSIVSGDGYTPIGTPPPGTFYNWERYKNPAMDQLFARYRLTLDTAQQHALVNQMQRLFVQELPVIPTQVETIPEEYNTTNFTGFPTAQDNYAYADPGGIGPDTLLMLMRIHPTH